jgi:hypothetical protein
VETKIQTGLQKIEVEITKKIKATPVFELGSITIRKV